MGSPEPTHRVWAIEYINSDREKRVVAVSAESEYGAVKRLVCNRCCLVRRVEVIQDRAPGWAQRRIEGYVDHEFTEGLLVLEYT
jgi:hypothetical protein